MYYLFGILTMLTSFSPDNFECKLCYGVYINDHAARKFTARERIWELQNKKLTYQIDAHNTLYSDTIALSDADIKELVAFLDRANIKESVSKNIEESYAAKYGYSASIRGTIKIAGKHLDIDFRSNTHSGFEEDAIAKELLEFEQLLYKLIEG